MPNIDTLDIQIKTSADKAVRAIRELSSALGNISGTINSINMSHFETSMTSAASAMKMLSDEISRFDISGLKEVDRGLKSLSRSVEKFNGAAKGSFRESSDGAKLFEQTARQSANEIAKSFGIKDAKTIDDLKAKFIQLARETNKGQYGTQTFHDLSHEIWNARNVVKDFGYAYQAVINEINSINKSGTKVTFPFSADEFRGDYANMRKYLGSAFKLSENSKFDTKIGFDSWLSGFDETTTRMLNSEMELLGLNTNSLASAFEALVNIKKKYNEAATKGAVAEDESNDSLQTAGMRVNDVIFKFMDLTKVFGQVADIGQGRTVSAFEVIARELQRLNGIQLPNAEQFNNIANAVSRISRIDTSNIQNLSLGKAGDELRKFSEAVSKIGSTPENLNQLINSITKLSRGSGGIDAAASALPKLSDSLNKFQESLSKIGEVGENATKLISAIVKMAKIGDKSQQISNNLDVIGEALKRFMQTMASAPTLNDNVVRMTEAIGNLNGRTIQIDQNLGTRAGGGASRFGNVIRSMAVGVGRAAARLFTLNGALFNFVPRIRRADKTSKGFVSTIGMMYAKFFLLFRAIRMAGNIVKDAMNSIEVINYFNAAVEQVTDRADLSKWKDLGYASADEYANSFKERLLDQTEKMSGYTINEAGNLIQTATKNFGIDTSVLMNYQAQFAQMASSIGVSSEYAVKISDALTAIGADLASVKNMDFKEVWDNMSSGLTGMSRAVDKYGINIRNAAMETELQRLGIDATVNSLSQADKAMLRTIIILNSSEYAWGDLSDRRERKLSNVA